MRVLLVGGGSFIGGHVARRLLQDGHEVTVFDTNVIDNSIHQTLSASELSQIRFVAGDVLDPIGLFTAAAFPRVDSLIHLAAALIPQSDANPALAVRINCDGLNHSLELARFMGLQRVVWASSDAVYGPQRLYRDEYPDEDAPHYPDSVYGACKSLNEHLGRHYFDRFGVDNIGLRFRIVYGPGRLRGAWSYRLGVELLEKPAVGLSGCVANADTLVCWQYVEDVASAIALSLYHEGSTRTRVFNTSGDVRTVREAVALVQSFLPEAKIEATPASG